MQNPNDMLKNQFYLEMDSYTPNWKVIAETNQHPDDCTDEKAYAKKRESFCKAMKHIRAQRGLKAGEMGSRLNYSRQYVYEIENNQIQLIPTHKFDVIGEVFGVSPAYLLGLTDKEDEFPDKTQCYFWEHPQNKYTALKEDLIRDSLKNPMSFFGPAPDELMRVVTEKLTADYELLYALSKIYKTNSDKRDYILNMIKSYSQLL